MRGVTAHLHHCTGTPDRPKAAERRTASCRATIKGAP